MRPSSKPWAWALVQFNLREEDLDIPAVRKILARVIPCEVRHRFDTRGFSWMAWIPELTNEKVGRGEGETAAECYLHVDRCYGTSVVARLFLGNGTESPGDPLLREVS